MAKLCRGLCGARARARLARAIRRSRSMRSHRAAPPAGGCGRSLPLGYILYHLGRPVEAQASCRTALRLRPETPEWRAFLGRALLLAGQFEEGWKEFEYRLENHPKLRVRHILEVPRWSGEAIRDRDILLIADQGLGDTLQFCRYVPQIAARARRTIVFVQEPLVRLLSRLPGGIEIYQRGRPTAFLRYVVHVDEPAACRRHHAGNHSGDNALPDSRTNDLRTSRVVQSEKRTRK